MGFIIGLLIGLVIGAIGGAFCYWYFVVHRKVIEIPENIGLK